MLEEETILAFVKTKWIIVNLVIETVLFTLLTGMGSFLMVYMFDKGYFLATCRHVPSISSP
jgi:hypothetical protein